MSDALWALGIVLALCFGARWFVGDRPRRFKVIKGGRAK
jgi:hypothetical protein